jgi:hypothetical protein
MQPPPAAEPSSPRGERHPSALPSRVVRNLSKDMRIKELETELLVERKIKSEAIEKLANLLQVTKELKKKYEDAQKQFAALQQSPSSTWASRGALPPPYQRYIIDKFLQNFFVKNYVVKSKKKENALLRIMWLVCVCLCRWVNTSRSAKGIDHL